MGGQVAVAARFKSGEIVCHERWTNPLGSWFKDIRFYTGDETYIRSYFAVQLEDEAHRTYPLAPSEYGIIFIDLTTNTILDMQYYLGLESQGAAQFYMLNEADNRRTDVKLDTDDINQWQPLIDDRRLFLQVIRYEQNGRGGSLTHTHHYDREILVTGSIFDLVAESSVLCDFDNTMLKRKSKRYINFRIDVRPMKLITFETGYGKWASDPRAVPKWDWRGFLKALDDLGVVLDKRSASAWVNWTREEI